MKSMTEQQQNWGLNWSKWLGGAAAGALLMYMLDPDRGSARRAQSGSALRGLTQQTGQAMRRLGSAASRGARTGGQREEFDSARTPPDGPAIRPDGAGEAARTGARQFMHQAGDSASQFVHGAPEMMHDAAERMRGDWSGSARGAAVLAGGLLGTTALMRRTPLALLFGVAGLALLARGATNQPLRKVVSGKALSQTIDLEKTIRIDAAPETVYDVWTNVENFPRFMSHVVEVRDLGNRRSHWVVRGPGGSQFEWDAVTTEQSRPHRLAWRTEPGAEIPQSGSIQFESYRGGTLVTVRMSYSPPAGVLGHGIAALLGADPKRQMDDDLARMKEFIERGGMPRNAAQGSILSRILH